jgi:predicted lysophospholipase L1 biosynthesis ABC-type transport system permease subunit
VTSCRDLRAVVSLSCSASGPDDLIHSRDEIDNLPVVRIYIPTDGTRAAENRVRVQAANLVPNALIHTQDDRVDRDARYLGSLEQLVRVFWYFVLIVAACSLTVGMLGGLVERRRPFALLRASGLRLGELRQVVFLETAVAMLLTAVVGVALGLGSSYALAEFRDLAWHWPDPGVFAMIGAGVLAALLLTTLALPLLDRATRHDAVRYE